MPRQMLEPLTSSSVPSSRVPMPIWRVIIFRYLTRQLLMGVLHAAWKTFSVGISPSAKKASLMEMAKPRKAYPSERSCTIYRMPLKEHTHRPMRRRAKLDMCCVFVQRPTDHHISHLSCSCGHLRRLASWGSGPRRNLGHVAPPKA